MAKFSILDKAKFSIINGQRGIKEKIRQIERGVYR